MRRILRGLIVFLVGAGLITAVYAMRSAVPVGSATSRLQQPATPAGLISTAMTPSLTGPEPNAIVANGGKPTSWDCDKPTIRPEGAKRRDADQHRAELARKPQSVGWGDSYAVRLSTSLGRPMVVSQIVLIAHMADGTVENVAMGALPERGIYRATLPTHQSAPINLQVRVSYGEQWVEMPVRR